MSKPLSTVQLLKLSACLEVIQKVTRDLNQEDDRIRQAKFLFADWLVDQYKKKTGSNQ